MCSARVDPNAICTADVCFCWLQSSSCVPQLSFPTSAKTCGNSFPGWSTNVDSWCGELSCVHVKDQSCIGQRVLHPHSPTWLARAPSAVRPSPVALGRADPRWWPPRRGAARRWWPPCWPPPRTSMATPPAGHSTRPPRRASRRCAPPPPPVDGPSALPCILGQPPFWVDSVLTTPRGGCHFSRLGSNRGMLCPSPPLSRRLIACRSGIARGRGRPWVGTLAPPQVVQQLLARGAAVDAEDAAANRALHAACRFRPGPGAGAVVRCLLAAAADANRSAPPGPLRRTFTGGERGGRGGGSVRWRAQFSDVCFS